MECSQFLIDLAEQFKNNNNSNYVNEFSSLYEYVRNELYKQNIMFKYNDSRGILYSNRYLLNSDSIARYCNGLVVELDTWEILAHSSPTLALNYNMNEIEKHFSEYSVTRARDGTTVVLYWWNDQWRMATGRAIEVNTLKQFGIDDTYINLFNEAVKSYDFSFDCLDKTKSYVVGFCHPKMHPFNDKPDAWIINIYRKDGTIQWMNVDYHGNKQNQFQ